MNPSQVQNLNSDNDNNLYAESSQDLKDGLTVTEMSLTDEEINRIFNARFADAANQDFFNASNSIGAKNIRVNSPVVTTLMAA